MCRLIDDEATALASALTRAKVHGPTFIKYLSTPVALAAGAAATSSSWKDSGPGRERTRSPPQW
eukprot:4670959-Heterocapsa_arctica.AAC.1